MVPQGELSANPSRNLGDPDSHRFSALAVLCLDELLRGDWLVSVVRSCKVGGPTCITSYFRSHFGSRIVCTNFATLRRAAGFPSSMPPKGHVKDCSSLGSVTTIQSGHTGDCLAWDVCCRARPTPMDGEEHVQTWPPLSSKCSLGHSHRDSEFRGACTGSNQEDLPIERRCVRIVSGSSTDVAGISWMACSC